MEQQQHPCLKIKGFWIFKYSKLEHNYKLNWITRFMNGYNVFNVNYECKKCHFCKTVILQEDEVMDELLINGKSIDILKQIKSDSFHNF